MTCLSFPMLLITWEIKENSFQTMWKQYILVLSHILTLVQKIIGSFPSGLQTINVTSIRIKSQKMVPAKLPLSYMQFINPDVGFIKSWHELALYLLLEIFFIVTYCICLLFWSTWNRALIVMIITITYKLSS